MRAREGVMESSLFGDELDLLYPIIEEGGSDSAAFDNVLELLVVNGVLSLPEAVMMMVPEAWQDNPLMNPDKKAFYQWAACQMEPWDGPALFTFSDGRYCGANLDRNGLRPCRFYVTSDDMMICASEVGTIAVDPEKVIQKGRLQPGRMLLVDTVEGRIVDDKELKRMVASKQNFKEWIANQMLSLPKVKHRLRRRGETLSEALDDNKLSADPRLPTFGYTFEQINLLLAPMVPDFVDFANGRLLKERKHLDLWATTAHWHVLLNNLVSSTTTSANSSLKSPIPPSILFESRSSCHWSATLVLKATSSKPKNLNATD